MPATTRTGGGIAEAINEPFQFASILTPATRVAGRAMRPLMSAIISLPEMAGQ